MSNFFKLLFASCLGTLLAIGGLIVLGFVTIGSIASAFGESDGVKVEANTVDELGKLVIARIQDVPGITRTLTCTVVHV